MDKRRTPVIENRVAHYDYFIEDTLECGIALKGNEVKSIRAGSASLKESWISIENGEMFIKQMHITPWETANAFDVDTTRVKKLLAHKYEIKEFEIGVKRKGYTVVPLKMYINDYGKCKVLVGLGRGKKDYDKREVSKERDVKREMDRAMKQYN